MLKVVQKIRSFLLIGQHDHMAASETFGHSREEQRIEAAVQLGNMKWVWCRRTNSFGQGFHQAVRAIDCNQILRLHTKTERKNRRSG